MGENDNKNKWALLIGIDHYPDFKDTLRLEGDQDLIANTLRNMLEGTYREEPGDVVPREPLDVGRLYGLLQDKAMSNFTLISDRCESGDLVFVTHESDADPGGGVGSKKGASRKARLLNLSKAIDDLDGSIRENPTFSEDQKADIAGDLLTIQAQVSKGNPIADIVMLAWVSFKSMAGPVGAGETARKVEYLLQRLL